MFKKRPVLTILCFLAFLIVTVIGVLIIGSIKGGSSLEEAQAAYISDGGSFDPTARFAKPVPDEENFGATPALNGITADTAAGATTRTNLELLGLKSSMAQWPKSNYRRRDGHEPRDKRDLLPFHQYFLDTALLPVEKDTTAHEEDILRALDLTHGALIAELNQASQRPANLLLPLEADRYIPGEIMFTRSTKELQTAQTIARGFALHSRLALRTGKPDAALDDIRTMQKLAAAVQADGSSIIANLVGIAISAISLEPIWEGLAEQSWDASQLEALQTILSQRQTKAELANAIHTELVNCDQLLLMIKNDPSLTGGGIGTYDFPAALISPWIAQNRALIIDFYHQGLLVPLKKPDGYLHAHAEITTRTDKLLDTADYNPKTILAKLVVTGASTFVEKSASAAAELTQAAIACALERYQLANGSYPKNLTDLVPDFAPTLPPDPLNGKPMGYKQTSDGRYQLHSVGIDGYDDLGGQGDITWNYEVAPPPPPPRAKKSRKRKRKSTIPESNP